MDFLASNYILYGGIILLIILIITFIVKKMVKMLFFIAAILVLFSAYNVFVKGVSPVEEVKGYITNIQYGKSVGEYSVKIKTSVENIKSAVESKKIDDNTKATIVTESSNLQKYQKEVQALKHTEKLTSFHTAYCGYVNTVVIAGEGTAKIASVTDGKNFTGLENMVSKMSTELSKLSSLKTEQFLEKK